MREGRCAALRGGMRVLALVAGLPGTAGALWLSEVLANPAGPENQDEFVELVNADSSWVEVDGLWLGDGTGEDPLVPWGEGAMRLPPGGRALVLDPDHAGAYLQELPADVVLLTVADGVLGSGGLSNSAVEGLVLRRDDGLVLDRVATRPDLPEGISLERERDGAVCDSCWSASRLAGGTPGRPNSVQPRPGELRVVGWEEDGPRLRAMGGAAFMGRLVWRGGLEPCLDSLAWGLELESGGEALAGPPPLPLPGLNPVRLEAEGEGTIQLLADTLLWRDPLPGEVYVEALQPDGRDWIQLRAGPCPVVLEGCRLSGRSFSWTLAGRIEAEGRWLAGAVEAECGPPPDETRSPALALAGGVELRSAAGGLMDAAHWPEPLGRREPWRRLDPSRDGADPDNWVPAPGLEPGCAPAAWPDRPGGGGGWILSTRVLGPLPAWERPLVVEAPPGVDAWTLDAWNLQGERMASLSVRGPLLVWSGLAESGQALAPGVVLLRLAAPGREDLQVLSVRP